VDRRDELHHHEITVSESMAPGPDASHQDAGHIVNFRDAVEKGVHAVD
jgi:hypothetical protein